MPIIKPVLPSYTKVLILRVILSIYIYICTHRLRLCSLQFRFPFFFICWPNFVTHLVSIQDVTMPINVAWLITDRCQGHGTNKKLRFLRGISSEKIVKSNSTANLLWQIWQRMLVSVQCYNSQKNDYYLMHMLHKLSTYLVTNMHLIHTRYHYFARLHL